jgi:CheY-like chemotaxis protein
MGTTFKLYFPITSGAIASSSKPADVTTQMGTGTETILLVEDTAMVRSLVTTLLSSYGYNVIAAASGPEAIEIAAQADRSIDLLMTDVVMPRMNGRELADRLTASRPDLRVLFTSGYPSDTVVRHGIAEARTAFIEKPYLPDDLARMVRDILDRPGS